MTAGPYLTPLRKPYVDGFTTRVALLRPESCGCVELASADPARFAVICQNFLTRDKDWKVLREGLRISQRIGQLRPLADFVDAQIARSAPGSARRTGHHIVAVLKETASGAKNDRVKRKKVMALAQAREIDAILHGAVAHPGPLADAR